MLWQGNEGMEDIKIQEIIEEFSLFDEWEDKYAYLIDLGKKLVPLPDADKTEANRVRGCTSTVWLVKHPDPMGQGKHIFIADSDAHIVKGLVAILLRVYSGRTTAEINAVDIDYLFQSLGLSQYLSPSRSNGFFAMVGRIKQLAGFK
jgi:cysteine desulfuration protein SufE